jgi:hypothetical protein
MLSVSRRTVANRCLDLLLLFPALLLVVLEHVLWAGSRALLRRIADIGFVRSAQHRLAQLPAYVALPLFLVPDAFSHVAGIWAAVLLARGHVVTATVVAVVFKGAATVVLVWIYQACETTLLRVAWFAKLHHGVLAARHWILERTRPMREAALHRLQSSVSVGGWIGWRFRRLRLRLARGLASVWPQG